MFCGFDLSQLEELFFLYSFGRDVKHFKIHTVIAASKFNQLKVILVGKIS